MKPINRYFVLVEAGIFYMTKHPTNELETKTIIKNDSLLFFSDYDNCIIKLNDRYMIKPFDNKKHFWEPTRKLFYEIS
jgi:hypothetical protein